ncbi:MAG: hypothetical protein OXB88_06200 [Bacteriovoracales bacterium]|nr:hypothetical protein [Bacteriovoracales bacterium]
MDLFGYYTKGMPSLEVYSHGLKSKILKEKLLFLTKSTKMKLPPRRYVLCMDIDKRHGSQMDVGDFELPFLILFWSLAEVIPIRRLDDCVCSGSISVSGLLCTKKLDSEYIRCLSHHQENLKIIDIEANNGHSFPIISLNSLIKNISNIRVQS